MEATNGEKEKEKCSQIRPLFCAGRKEAVLKGELCSGWGISINLKFAHYPRICSETDPRMRVSFFQTQLSRAHIPRLKSILILFS